MWLTRSEDRCTKLSLMQLTRSENVVKASQGFTLAVIFEMLEKIDIPFDQDGNPELPEIHIHPESAETLKEALIIVTKTIQNFVVAINEILLGKKGAMACSRGS